MSGVPHPASLDHLQAALAGRYHLVRELGAGGMAVVYLARDTARDRDVALKVLRPELSPVAGAERFDREIRLAAGLVHPNILPLLDSGTAAGHLWYTMPFVEGESVRARLDRENSCRSTRLSALPVKLPTPWATPTPGASSTATSSPKTFSSPRATPWWPTSGSLGP